MDRLIGSVRPASRRDGIVVGRSRRLLFGRYNRRSLTFRQEVGPRGELRHGRARRTPASPWQGQLGTMEFDSKDGWMAPGVRESVGDRFPAAFFFSGVAGFQRGWVWCRNARMSSSWRRRALPGWAHDATDAGQQVKSPLLHAQVDNAQRRRVLAMQIDRLEMRSRRNGERGLQRRFAVY